MPREEDEGRREEWRSRRETVAISKVFRLASLSLSYIFLYFSA